MLTSIVIITPNYYILNIINQINNQRGVNRDRDQWVASVV
jgi:hypothetical protein